MPDYIWQMVFGYMPDGVYSFPEGTLTIANGFVAKWEEKEDNKEEET